MLAAGRRQDPLQLDDVLLAVPDDEPLRDGPDGHLAQARVLADPGCVRLGEGRQSFHPPMQPSVDPREQHPQRQRSVAGDQPDARGVIRDPAEWHRSPALAVHDPLQLAEPEGEHLGDMGKDLARTPRRLGFRAEVFGQRPRLTGGDTRSQGRVRGAGIGESIQVGGQIGGRHGRQCRTWGVR